MLINTYKKRIIDELVDRYLKVFGAISIEGPKWCGKTWTSKYHANSIISLDDKKTFEKASLDLSLVLNEKEPLVIDEWIMIPEIWDKIRHLCDEDKKKGRYILTCSTRLNEDEKKKVYHSGAGRIGKIKMSTMSLYETGDSSGDISLQKLSKEKIKTKKVKKYELKDIAHFIIRGGWPGNINTKKDDASLIPESYIYAFLDGDIQGSYRFERNKMLTLLKSLARNESTLAGVQTIINDIDEYENNEQLKLSKNTINTYIDALAQLRIIDNQDAFGLSLRSSCKVGKSVKRHFCDVSLASALMNITVDKLLNDVETFGFLYEALVEHDLKIYIESVGGKLYHYRENLTGLEVDAIVEFKDSSYGAIEIKLGTNKINEAIENLVKFNKKISKKPKFMCVIVGTIDYIYQDEKTGVYVFPITTLKP